SCLARPGSLQPELHHSRQCYCTSVDTILAESPEPSKQFPTMQQVTQILQAAGFYFEPRGSTERARAIRSGPRAYFASGEALPWAVQLAVVIGDVTPATLEVIEVCITITSITCPATCD